MLDVNCAFVDREFIFEAKFKGNVQKGSSGVFTVTMQFEPGYARWL